MFVFMSRIRRKKVVSLSYYLCKTGLVEPIKTKDKFCNRLSDCYYTKVIEGGITGRTQRQAGGVLNACPGDSCCDTVYCLEECLEEFFEIIRC